MCQAIRELMEDARNEGIERGIEQGIERGIERGIEQGIKRGIAQGMKQGYENFISVLQELGVSYPDAMLKLKEKFRLDDQAAEENMQLYWKGEANG